MKKFYALAFTLLFGASAMYAQCTQWALPTPTTSWPDFASAGGAPCAPTPPASVTLPFGSWAAESYLMPNIRQGGSYTYDICTGYLTAAQGGWTVVFTILDENGGVVASGRDVGSNCALTFTAPSTGTYTMIANRGGSANCGVPFVDAQGNNIENGNPRITYNGGADCGPVVTTCEAGTLSTTGNTGGICADEFVTLNLTGTVVPTSPTQGAIGIFFTPGPGATGGIAAGFRVTGYTTADFPYELDSSIDGILPANNIPNLAGTWTVQPYVYANSLENGVACDTTIAVNINFLAPGTGSCEAEVCEAGLITSGDQVLCPGDDWALTLSGETLPGQGLLVWVFLSLTDTTGASDEFLNFGNNPEFYNFNGDLNALLVEEELDPIAPGAYLVFAGVFDLAAGAYCSFTENEMIIEVLAANDPICNPVPPCTVPYPQVTGTASTTLPNGILLTWNPIPGSLGCQIQGGLASGGPQELFQVIQPALSQFFIPQGQLTAGQTYRWRVRCGCSFTVGGPFTPYSNFTWNPGGGRAQGLTVQEFAHRYDGKTFATPETGFRGVIGVDLDHVPSITLMEGNKELRKRLPAVEIVKTPLVAQSAPFDVFPNPTTGTVNVRFDAVNEGLVTVRVFDAVGKLVHAEAVGANNGINLITLELAKLERGLYTLELVQDGTRSTERVVLTR